MKISIITPTFNEVENIEKIYDQIKKTYEYFDIRIVEIPFGSPSERILKIVDIINDGKQH